MDIEQLAGTKLGNYEIESLLGRGGMGVVYKARQESLDRFVALKILPPSLSSDSSYVKRFEREARAIAKLTHPNIVQIYDVGQEGPKHYYTMELVDGVSVDNLLEQHGTVPLNRAVHIIARVANALAYMHDRGIVHRDVKPSNIMVDTLKKVKLMDFGLVLQEEVPRVTVEGGIVGTPEYMSPEQASGERATPQSDIFSLGVVFYELLTGDVPFQGDTPLSVIRKIHTEEPIAPRRINPEIPPEIERIILKMMAKAPERRYADCRAVRADLKQFRSRGIEVPSGTKILSPRRLAMIATLIFLSAALTWGLASYLAGRAKLPPEKEKSARKQDKSLLTAGKGKKLAQESRQELTNTLDVLVDGISAPAGMALTPEGNLLVASRRDGGRIHKIELANEEKASVSSFATGVSLCNPQYIAVDNDGLVYVNTGRPTVLYRTRRDGFTHKSTRWVGIFQISQDGQTFTRIESIKDDTRGLAIDPKGNLFSCNGAPPIKEEEQTSKFAERTAEKIFSSSKDLKPYILKLDLKGDSPPGTESKIIKRLETLPTDILFDSKGNLFYVADNVVSKIRFGLFGRASRPKPFAVLQTADTKGAKSVGLGIDGSDNLYVGLANPYIPAGGTVLKVDTDGNVTTFAKGLMLPADIVSDPEGNIYISDMQAKKVYRVSAAAKDLPGPFRPKKKPKMVPPAKRPVIAERELHPVATAKTEPESVAKKSELPSELEKLEKALASVEAQLSAKENLIFPDTIVLKTGKEVKCEILDETDDFVRIKTSRGSANMFHDRIESIKYATQAEREEAVQARSEIKALKMQRTGLASRIKELWPPEELDTSQD